MDRYRAFLAAPHAVRVLGSSLLARLPLGMGPLALVLLVRGRGGSFALAGVTAGAFTLVGAASTPFQGRLVTRFGPMRVIVVTCIAQGLSFGCLAIAAHLGASAVILLVAVVVAGAFVPPISACSRSLWPRLTAPDDADAAYALDAISQELLWTSGPLCVALAVAIGSPVLAVCLQGAVTVLGGLWFATAPVLRSPPPMLSVREHGTQRLLTAPVVALLLTIMLAGAANGSVAIGMTALAAELGMPVASGALLAMASVGSVIGGLLHGARIWKRPPHRRCATLLALTAILVLPMISARSLDAALALSALAGLGWSAVYSCQYAALHALTPPDRTTEAFSWNTSAVVVGSAAGTALAGITIGVLGHAAPFLLSATVCLAACLLAVTGASPSRDCGAAPDHL